MSNEWKKGFTKLACRAKSARDPVIIALVVDQLAAEDLTLDRPVTPHGVLPVLQEM